MKKTRSKKSRDTFPLKGQCHKIFDFWFFSWISFPQASEYTITAISNFFENSRWYSRLKVHHRCQRHRWQMEKIFKQKSFNNFVWAPLGSRVNIYINFCLQVYFKVSAAWYCSHYLPPVSLIPVASCHRRCWHRRWICRRCRWHRWQICHRCQQHKGNWWQTWPPVSLIPVANLPPVSLIPEAICHRCHWHRCTLTCKYIRKFSTKFETVLMGYSGAGGKLIHKKNQKQKISWHCPFKSKLK